MFGKSAQKAEIKRLKDDIRILKKELVHLQDVDADHEISADSMRTNHRLVVDSISRVHAVDRLELVNNYEDQIASIRNQNEQLTEMLRSQLQIKLTKAENALKELESSISVKVNREIASEKKELKIKGEKQDKEHADRMKKLESEYASKIAKSDKDLESDKVSYRKYIRSEYNKQVENLEKENKKLVTDNIELNTSVKANKYAIGILEGQIKSMNGVVDTLSEANGNLSESIASGLVKAMPNITASFETPVLPENHVHFEQAGAAKGGNQGGGKQKQEN